MPQDTNPTGKFVLLLDHLQDHGNVGAIFRSATAFGIKDIAFTHDADPYFKKTIDASRGTVFRSKIKRYPSTKDALTHLKKSYQIIATSPRGTQLQSLAPLQNKPIVLVLGNETSGVQQEILDQADLVVQIPMSSAVESLNVAVFAGLSMYELKLRMILTMLTTFITKTLGRQVNVAGQLIQQAFHTALQQVTDLSATQVILLMIMTVDQTMTSEQIAQDTGSELETLLAPLLSQNLITKEQDTYYITERGKETIVKLWPIVEATEEKIVANFSDKEKQQLHDYLERIQNNCMKLISSP